MGNAPKPTLLEVCVASLDDALAAVAGGADRLEVNCALALGGLTPSYALFQRILYQVKIPVIALVRPRPGGFCYSQNDFEVMLHDASLFIEGDAAGVAFGFLTSKGEIDASRCKAMRDCFGNRVAVFHRAFDLTPDPFTALETLIDLGIHRVMTSGQAPTAVEGIPLIAELIQRAKGRIEILPAGGISSGVMRELVERTGCDQVHGSLRTSRLDPAITKMPRVPFSKLVNVTDEILEFTDVERVRPMKKVLSENQ